MRNREWGRLSWGAISALLVATLACAAPTPGGQAAATRIELEEVARIGCTGCSGPQLITSRSITTATDGDVYLVDHYAPFVRVFAPSGEPLRLLGEEGEGPGEMRMPGWVYLNKDGSFWVHDGMPSRLTLYDASGELIRTVGLSPFRVPVITAYDQLRRTLYMVTFDPGTGEGGPRIDRWDLASGEPVHEVVQLRNQEPGVPDARADESGFVPGYAFSVSPAGNLVIGDPWSYEIRVLSADGEPLYSLGRDLPTLLKTDAELQLEEENEEEFARRMGFPATKGVRREKPHFGRFALDHDDDGRLWVHTNRATEQETAFDVFAENGDFIGEVILPVPVRGLQGQAAKAFDVAGDYLGALFLTEQGDTHAGLWRVRYRPQAAAAEH